MTQITYVEEKEDTEDVESGQDKIGQELMLIDEIDKEQVVV